MGGVIGVCKGHHSSLSDAIEVEVLGIGVCSPTVKEGFEMADEKRSLRVGLPTQAGRPTSMKIKDEAFNSQVVSEPSEIGDVGIGFGSPSVRAGLEIAARSPPSQSGY